MFLFLTGCFRMFEQQRIVVVVSACHVVMDKYRSCLYEHRFFKTSATMETFEHLSKSGSVANCNGSIVLTLSFNRLLAIRPLTWQSYCFTTSSSGGLQLMKCGSCNTTFCGTSHITAMDVDYRPAVKTENDRMFRYETSNLISQSRSRKN